MELFGVTQGVLHMYMYTHRESVGQADMDSVLTQVTVCYFVDARINYPQHP